MSRRHQWVCHFSVQIMHVVIAKAGITPLLEVAHQHSKTMLMENLDLKMVGLHQNIRHIRRKLPICPVNNVPLILDSSKFNA